LRQTQNQIAADEAESARYNDPLPLVVHNVLKITP
jgi:hypothetical protein